MKIHFMMPNGDTKFIDDNQLGGHFPTIKEISDDMLLQQMYQQIIDGEFEGNRGRHLACCWGADNWVAKNTNDISSKYRRKLSFDVNGFRYQGKVSVFLTYLDDYEIVFEDTQKVVAKNVYCDELLAALDMLIETGGDK